ncbi:MAG: glutamate 5-kinase [Desulfovibrio sp.]|uniref:glutamate 5-kinase n=1 Tax=Desulfovibrio sp. 7SRBS1 TaxID=3378064 RepID=UPI003B40EFFD
MDWRERKEKVLHDAKRIVVKVGSAVLTGRQGLDLRVVNRLADQIAKLHDDGLDVVVVSSGAVAAGRKAIIHCQNCMEGEGLPDKQAVAAIGQSRLMHEYDEAFARYGKTTAQVLLTKDDFKKRQRYLNARNTLRTLLSWHVIPVINENDTVAVAELKFGDNDSLASMVLSLVEADLFVNLTSAKGVFDMNPDTNPEARPIEYIEDIAHLDIDAACDGKTNVGSGGMHSKLQAARRVAQLAVPTLIVSGLEPFALEKALSGETSGTWIMPEENAVSARKFWLAYNSEPVGSIWVDQGAARALMEGGKSLLSAGISRVEGKFGKGELVRILDYQGQTVGVGLSNYNADNLRRIMGKKSSDIPEILGPGMYSEAVHRDNLMLDPAL